MVYTATAFATGTRADWLTGVASACGEAGSGWDWAAAAKEPAKEPRRPPSVDVASASLLSHGGGGAAPSADARADA